MSSTTSQNETATGILAQRYADEALRYLDRRRYLTLPALPPPDPGLNLVIVVPALDEPDVIATIESVAAAQRPGCAVELLLVVNAPDNAGPRLRRASAQCLADAHAWASGAHGKALRCQALDCRDLPVAHAGVGLARKIGMDTALARLAMSDSGRGVIVSLDADCYVAPTYLIAIDDYFRLHQAALGATIYFEHPLDEAPAGLRAAIIDYELHLRCYRQGLQTANSTFASHTVGSAFAVRSEIYAQEGGMNRRAAGEDFYFINKLLKRGRIEQINNTTVFPSSRVSDRVPFGTGAALRRVSDKPITTYAPAVYPKLRAFHSALDAHIRTDHAISADYQPFLDAMAFETWLSKTRANVASLESLAEQLRRWLDGFRTMKFIHWLSESRFPRIPPAQAAAEILGWSGLSVAGEPQGMLQQFRTLDRQPR